MTMIDSQPAMETVPSGPESPITPLDHERLQEIFDLRMVPRSWYLVCRSHEIPRGGVVAKEFLGQSLVIFRTMKGKVNALAAQCAHMGANLAGGDVRGDCLRCPLHHRSFDGNGTCSSDALGVRQRAWPVEERFGCVFLFHGERALGELPFFETLRSDEIVTAVGKTVLIQCPPVAVLSNAFDVQHLNAVHERALRQPPQLDTPSPHRLRLRYISRVTGGGIADKVTKWLSNDHVNVAITCWGGSMFTVESRLGKRPSMLCLGLTPTRRGVEATPIVAMRHRGFPGADAIRLKMALWLFTGFLSKDLSSLQGMKFRVPERFMAADDVLRRFLSYLQDLPRAPAGFQDVVCGTG